jgi:sec-independent protein translocase protein TatA
MPSWIGWPEIVVVAIIALVIFGPKRLPELGHSIGKAITGFRRGLSEAEQEVKRGMAETTEVASPAKAEVVSSESARTDASEIKESKG